jgi:hypothetical protein
MKKNYNLYVRAQMRGIDGDTFKAELFKLFGTTSTRELSPGQITTIRRMLDAIPIVMPRTEAKPLNYEWRTRHNQLAKEEQKP